MKKHFLYCCFLAGVLSLPNSCSSELKSDIDEGRVESFSVSLDPLIFEDDLGSLTRSSIEKDEGGYYQVWTEGDVIGVFPNTGSQIEFAIQPAYYNQRSAVFDGGGWALRTGYQYAAYYPFNYDYKDKSALPVNFIGQKQVGNNNMAHINRYNFFVSKNAIVAESSSLEFGVQFVGHLCRFIFTMPEAGNFTKLRIKSSAIDFAKTATMDISGADPIMSDVKTARKVILELEGISTAAADEVITLYMWLCPRDLTGTVLTAEVVSDAGKVYRTTLMSKN